eukprot:Skav215029  [mRNA]  locus=scaffold966:534535:552062:- [translate_table: standard]
MRVIPGRLLHILEEGGRSQTKRFHGPGSARSSQSDAARSEVSRGAGINSLSMTSDSEERTAYDLLHKEQGFQAFRSWYFQQLRLGQPGDAVQDGAAATAAFNFFRLLDASMLGALKFQQVYLATVLISAWSSRQLTKCLYLHSRWLFQTITEEPPSRGAGVRRLPWPRLQSLFQLLGANWIFISRN